MARKLQEFSLYNLLGYSKAEHHEGIRILWADPKVQYLVLFKGRGSDEKAILTVGPDLDYTSLEEILEVVIDGMRPTAFVKSRHYNKFNSPRKKIIEKLSTVVQPEFEDPFDGNSDEEVKPLPAMQSLSQSSRPEAVREPVAEEPSKGLSVEDSGVDTFDMPSLNLETASAGRSQLLKPTPSALEKATLDEAWAEIHRREEEIENLRQEILARESFVTDSENRLLELSQQHHERQEELNHKMDALKKWEIQLSDRERRVAKLESGT